MKHAIIDKAEKIALQVLQDVRPQLLAEFGKVSFDLKHDKTTVTQLDRMVEERLRDALRPIDPAIGIVGEELGQEGNPDTYWLLDPIDGTEQFIRGIPSSKNLLCLMEDGKPVWALMYMFIIDELWTARKGQGTLYNGRPFQLPYRPLKEAWFGFTLNTANPDFPGVVEAVRSKVHKVSGAHTYSEILSGKVDGLVTLGSPGGLWDYGPRILLYEEAGGRVAQFGEQEFDFTRIHDGQLYAHAKNFDELMKIVTDTLG